MMPVFGSLEEERKYRKEHLALVFRIFHRFKMAEGIAGTSHPTLHSNMMAYSKATAAYATPSNPIHSGSTHKVNHLP